MFRNIYIGQISTDFRNFFCKGSEMFSGLHIYGTVILTRSTNTLFLAFCNKPQKSDFLGKKGSKNWKFPKKNAFSDNSGKFFFTDFHGFPPIFVTRGRSERKTHAFLSQKKRFFWKKGV